MDKLSLVVAKRIWTKLFSLETDPRPQGSLKLSGTGGYRIRIGDYRIDVARIAHRREVYR